MKPLKLLHVLAFDVGGGLENQVHQYLGQTTRREIEQHVLVTRGRLHPAFRQGVEANSRSVRYARYWRGIRLPRRPAALRQGRLRSLLGDLRPDVAVLYNCLGNLELADAAHRAGAVCVYFERGAAWTAHEEGDVTEFLGLMDVLLANSYAGKRMLELRWNARGREVLSHLNPIRGDIETASALPAGPRAPGPLRLGIAGRMVPFKGFPLALHALRLLSDKRLEVEMLVAGTGPGADDLRALARRLAVERRVRFLGYQRNPADFYRQVDILVCPSIREPFGNVCVEAERFGRPVVAGAVDGIPESVLHQRTGICLAPTLPLEAYAEFGGSMDALPEFVYDPAADKVTPPKLLDPREIAAVVESLHEHPELRESLGAEAARHVAANYRFDDYVHWFEPFILGLRRDRA